MPAAQEHRFDLPESEFHRLPHALRERWVSIINDAASYPSSVSIVLPFHLVPDPPAGYLYEESDADGRFVELRAERYLPQPVQDVQALLAELGSAKQPKGPLCLVARHRSSASKHIEVVLKWEALV